MNLFLNFLLTVAIVIVGSVVLYYAWRWALENFNLGHIQLQDMSSRRSEYQSVQDSE